MRAEDLTCGYLYPYLPRSTTSSISPYLRSSQLSDAIPSLCVPENHRAYMRSLPKTLPEGQRISGYGS